MVTNADFIRAMNWVVASNKQHHLEWHYLQSRPIELDMKFPKHIDCSGTFTFIYRMLGLKDPNQFGYSGIGNTAILAAKGKLIKPEESTPGDAVIFCPDDDISKQHISMVAEVGKKDPTCLSMGTEGDPSWMRPSQDSRPHKFFTFDKTTVMWPPYDFSTFNPPFQACHPDKHDAPKPQANRPMIKLGSKGPNVQYLQKKLNLNTDGVFSIITEKAVKIFQQKHGLEVDGVVGPKTWEKLG